MKACVWLQEDDVSDSYHNGGGVLVIADSADEAKSRVPRLHGAEPVGDPDRIWDVFAAEPEVIVFVNAGCC